jgi:hypothetical protein
MHLKRSFNPKGIVPSSPGLRAGSYPGKIGRGSINLKEVAPFRGDGTDPDTAARLLIGWHNSFGVEYVRAKHTQGSSLLATLGFVAESLWDSPVRADCEDSSMVQDSDTAPNKFD